LSLVDGSLEIVFVEVFGLDLVKLVEVDFEIAGDCSGEVLVVDGTGELEAVFGHEMMFGGRIESLQVVPDTDGVIEVIVGTEASHMVLGRGGVSVELVGNEEDVKEVESEEDAGDGEDLGPHQTVNF
jgi:hypothetical protein